MHKALWGPQSRRSRRQQHGAIHHRRRTQTCCSSSALWLTCAALEGEGGHRKPLLAAAWPPGTPRAARSRPQPLQPREYVRARCRCGGRGGHVGRHAPLCTSTSLHCSNARGPSRACPCLPHPAPLLVLLWCWCNPGARARPGIAPLQQRVVCSASAAFRAATEGCGGERVMS
jgi:hypothetical protein